MRLKRAGILTKIIVMALVLYSGICLVNFKAKSDEIKVLNEQLQIDVAALAQKNAEVQYEIDHSEDPDTIEDIARDKLGLVMPGEIIFYDVSK